METSFSDRYNILSKLILLRNLILFAPILIGIGCDSKKDYYIDPVPVFSKIVKIDSSYTSVRVISTGTSNLLFCGKKDVFDSYSIMKFDSIPENFGSLFLRFVSDTFTCELTLFALEQEWYEDSVYEWNDIGSLIDTTSPIQVATMYPVPVDSPATDTNSLIFLGDSLSLDASIISSIGNYGLAVHSDRFYSFSAGETRLKVESEDTLADSIILCVEDAYIVKNPFQDTIFTDSLLVGRGLSIRTHIFIPRDSLPLGLNKIAEAELVIDIADTVAFTVGANLSTSELSFTSLSSSEGDSLRFDLASFFRSVPDDSIFHIKVEAREEKEGIGFEKLGDSEIKFIWVEFP